MTKRVALITGVTGQDGSHLAELLLEKGYIVHGIKRRTSLLNTDRIDHLYSDLHERGNPFFIHYGDLTDVSNLVHILKKTKPTEIYNLGAQSHVQVSFEGPQYALMTNAMGALNLLEAIRILDMEEKVRFYQASSSEMFGSSPPPQNEQTPFQPRSPYAIAKLYAFWATVNYRDAYNMHASNGILFNHESANRGETFVTRKITRAVAAIAHGAQDRLYLGNLDARRDWGHAADYMEGAWLMLQQTKPDDYVLASGEAHSVREFVEHAFFEIGCEVEWRGKGINEVGLDRRTGRTLVQVDIRYFRPTEVDCLIGDWSKARRLLGWKPRTGFRKLITEMVAADIAALKEI